MRKGTVISLIALLVSIVGLLVALIAYFKRRSCALCDDMDDDLMEYYDDEDGEDCSCGCACPEDASTKEEEAALQEEAEQPAEESPADSADEVEE